MERERYDYIIVGAGAAGTVIASRLTTDMQQEAPLHILLLECGKDNRTKDMDKDMAAPNPMKLWGDQSLTFNDCVVARSAEQPPRSYPVGKCVGGGSAINGMGAIRGHPDDFKEWATLTSDKAWDWEHMLGAYKRIECDPLHTSDNQVHGNNPNRIPIHRIDVQDWGPVAKAMKLGSEETFGFPFHYDLNHPEATGVSPFPMNMKTDGQGQLIRVGTNDAYLDPVRCNSDALRNTLTVRTNTLVNRIVFAMDEKSGKKRAIGVEVIGNQGKDTGEKTGEGKNEEGSTIILYATHEIVLTAGALNSPAILQRSGVGPAEVLNKHDIPVVQECAVGKGLQDHPAINGKIILKDSYEVSKRHANALSRFTSNVGGECLNDLYFVSVEQGNDPRAKTKEAEEVEEEEAFPVGYIDVMLMHCKSRGSVHIQSKDPHKCPVVNENMLSDVLDKARMRHGVHQLVALLRSPAVEAIARVSSSGEPMIELGRGTDGHGRTMDEVERMTDAELDAWMVKTLSDGIHICSSCPMGPGGVVDSDGKVRGLEAVRVCDASVFPTVPRANTHLTVIAAAELFADKIVQGLRSPGNESKDVHIARLKACPQFSHEIAALLLEEWPSENNHETNSNTLAAQLLEQDTQGLQHAVDNKFMMTWVATVGNKLAGTIRFCSHDMEGKDEPFGCCWVAALYVKEEYRHQSVGRTLVQSVLEYKNDQNHEYVVGRPLHLWFPTTKGHLMQFYASCGFEVVEEVMRFDKSSFGEDVVVMKEV